MITFMEKLSLNVSFKKIFTKIKTDYLPANENGGHTKNVKIQIFKLHPLKQAVIHLLFQKYESMIMIYCLPFFTFITISFNFNHSNGIRRFY